MGKFSLPCVITWICILGTCALNVYGIESTDYIESLKDDAEDEVTNSRKESATEYPNGVNVIPGDAETHYPIYDKIPKSAFSCHGRIAGFYADTDLRCQVWHICDETGDQKSFLCTNGTIYSQDKRVCDWWYNVNCDPVEVNRNYQQNAELYKGPPSKNNKDEELSFNNELPTPVKTSNERRYEQPQQPQRREFEDRRTPSGNDNRNEQFQERPTPRDRNGGSFQNHVEGGHRNPETNRQVPNNNDNQQRTSQQFPNAPAVPEKKRVIVLRLPGPLPPGATIPPHILREYAESVLAAEKAGKTPPTGLSPNAGQGSFQNQNRPVSRPTQQNIPQPPPAHAEAPRPQAPNQGPPKPTPRGPIIPYTPRPFNLFLAEASRHNTGHNNAPAAQQQNIQPQQYREPQPKPQQQQYREPEPKPQQQQYREPEPKPQQQQYREPQTKPQQQYKEPQPQQQQYREPQQQPQQQQQQREQNKDSRQNQRSQSASQPTRPTAEYSEPPTSQPQARAQETYSQRPSQQRQQTQQAGQYSDVNDHRQDQHQQQLNRRPSTNAPSRRPTSPKYEEPSTERQPPAENEHRQKQAQQSRPSHAQTSQSNYNNNNNVDSAGFPAEKKVAGTKPPKVVEAPHKKFRHSTPRKHGEVKFAPKSQAEAEDQFERQFPDESRRPAYPFQFNNFNTVPYHLSADVSSANSKPEQPIKESHTQKSPQRQKVQKVKPVFQEDYNQDQEAKIVEYEHKKEKHVDPQVHRLTVVARQGIKIKDPRPVKADTASPTETVREVPREVYRSTTYRTTAQEVTRAPVRSAASRSTTPATSPTEVIVPIISSSSEAPRTTVPTVQIVDPFHIGPNGVRRVLKKKKIPRTTTTTERSTKATEDLGFDVYGRNPDDDEEEELIQAAQMYLQASEHYGKRKRPSNT